MSDADLEYGPTPPDAEYEHTDIEPSLAGKFAVWLGIAMALSGGIVYGTFWLFEARTQKWNAEMQRFPLAVGRVKEPPAPRLQTQPFKDVWQLKRDQNEKLSAYGWVDQGTGIVHIPIEEAMRVVAERGGVPTSGEQAPGTFDRRAQDSSAGRTPTSR